MTPWEQALSEALLHFVWQGAAIATLLWLVLSMLRNYSSNARYVASCAGLTLLASLPLVTAVAVYSPSEQAEATSTYTRSALTSATELSRVVYPGVASVLFELKPYALPLWAAGVAVFGLRLIWSWSHTRKLRTNGTHADAELLSLVSQVGSRLGITRKVQVLMSAIAEVPSAIGWLRPVLLLPASAIVGLTPAQLEAVVAHELAHIRRHDYFVNLLQSLAEALLFYHPAVWWVSGRIRYERELCCDDLAVELCGDPVCYARALALLEKRRVLRPSLAMGSAGGPLVLRIRRLLMTEKREYSSWRLVCGLGLLAGVLGLALNAGWAKGQQRTTDRPVAELARAETSATLLQPGEAQTSSSEKIPTAQFLALLEASVQQNNAGLGTVNSPTSWVLFNDGQRLSNASSEDEGQAVRAFQSAGGAGRFLWFRHEGKVYISQDSAVMDRILALYRTGQVDDQTKIAAAVQRDEFLAQVAPLRQAEDETKRRQLEVESAKARAEQRRIQAELDMLAARQQELLRYGAEVRGAQGDATGIQREQSILRSYNQALGQQLVDREKQLQALKEAFERQIRDADGQYINKAFEQQIREADRQTQEINKAFEQQIREPGRAQEINKAFEQQIREAAARVQEVQKAFEQTGREADARAQEINKALEQSREADTRVQLDELKFRLQSMEAELAAARAELARERAVNAGRAQPEVNRALRDAVESGRAKPVQ